MYKSFTEYALAVQEEHGIDTTLTLTIMQHTLEMVNVSDKEVYKVEKFKPRNMPLSSFTQLTKLLRNLSFFKRTVKR